MADAYTKYHKIYNAMEKLGIFKVTEEVGHIRVKNGEYMDFIVENLGSPRKDVEIYSLAHYQELNGDLIPDPEQEIEVNHATRTADALTFQTGHFPRTLSYRFDKTGKKTHVSPQARKDNNDFLKDTWLRNLKEQGFKEAINNHFKTP